MVGRKTAAHVSDVENYQMGGLGIDSPSPSMGFLSDQLAAVMKRSNAMETGQNIGDTVVLMRDKQKANGYLGGRPKLTQIEPKPFENDNPEPKPEKALQSSSSNIVTTDTPPTQEAVVAYGRSPHGGIPEAVAVAFWRNFQSVGWIDAAGRKITDWKQALHKWATNQGNHGKTNRNSQRSYEPDQRVKNSTDAAREGITLKTTKF